ncbi:hypothetical protein VKT23_018371 [Stygiomarasmius scandens]|uniref:Uncharacterized protein n=1 Tax=Marasmiellus scandens TaxID=2682957 RepID=A0ABR1IPN6_9AGAR
MTPSTSGRTSIQTHRSRPGYSSLPPSSGPGSRSPSPPTDYDAVLASLKRKIDELEEENRNLKGKQTKKPITCRTLGRPIRRLVSLFTSVNTIVAEYDRRCIPGAQTEDEELDNVNVELLNPVELEEYEQRMDLKRIRDRDHEAFNILCKHVPYLRKKLYSKDIDHLELQEEYRQLEIGANGARSEDIYKAQKELVDWLHARNPAPNPLLDRMSRVGRGLTHDVTGWFICPVDLDWNDPVIRSDLRTLVKSVVGDSKLPFFFHVLYHDEKGDPENPLKGWLQGPLLVKMLCMIFKSASSVGEEVVDGNVALNSTDDEDNNMQVTPSYQPSSKRRKPTRKNVAQILNIDAVTPRMIAYAAVMLRFALSDVAGWGSDRSFPYESFYNAIIDFFEDVELDSEDELRNKKLLAWWNKTVFPPTDASLSASTKPLKDFRNVLKAQRAAKSARSHAAAAAKAAQSQSQPV